MKNLILLFLLISVGIVNAQEPPGRFKSNLVITEVGYKSAITGTAQVGSTVTVEWQADNATNNIQKAIESGAEKIILENHGTPWKTGPIRFNKPNQEIWIANGATVEAYRDAKLHPEYYATKKHVNMFTFAADNVTLNGYANGVDASDGVATLKMFKDDYLEAPYEGPSEWRHAVAIWGYKNLTLKGLTIQDSGGDGISVSDAQNDVRPRVAANNVLIKDVVSKGNFRQGMSVTNSNGLLVTNCTFMNTGGGSPEAGVDFEPDVPEAVLTGIRLVGCKFLNNAGDNVTIALRELKGTNLTPIDIRLEGCTMEGSNRGISMLWLQEDGPKGSIVIENCSIKDSGSSGLFFGAWSAGRASVTVSNTQLNNCSTNENNAPIEIQQTVAPIFVAGNISFVGNCKIVDLKPTRRYMLEATPMVREIGLKDITGSISVDRISTYNPMTNFGDKLDNVTLKLTDSNVTGVDNNYKN